LEVKLIEGRGNCMIKGYGKKDKSGEFLDMLEGEEAQDLETLGAKEPKE